MMGDGPDQLPGEAYVTQIGVLICLKNNKEPYVVPYANVENMQLKEIDKEEEVKRGPGRPPKSQD